MWCHHRFTPTGITSFAVWQNIFFACVSIDAVISLLFDDKKKIASRVWAIGKEITDEKTRWKIPMNFMQNFIGSKLAVNKLLKQMTAQTHSFQQV